MGQTRDRALEGVEFFTGQKSGLPPKTLKPSDCEVVKNFLTNRRAVERVNGNEEYASIVGFGRISWLDSFSSRWLTQRGTDILLEDSENSGTFTSVITADSDDPLLSDKYRGEIYLTNGTDQKVYKVGGSSRNIGLQSPISPTALNGADTAQIDDASGGGLTVGRTYKVTFTYYDEVNNIESPVVNIRPNADGLCSLTPASTNYWSVLIAGGNDMITIKAAYLATIFANTYNGTTLKESNALKIRVYMTGGTGVNLNVFRKYADYTISGLVDINIIAETTGVLLPENNIPPVSKLRQQEKYFFVNATTPPSTVGESVYKSVRFFRDSLFGFGAKGLEYSPDRSYDSILYIHEPFQPDYVFDTREVSRGDGQEGVGVAVLRDSVLIILKKGSTYYLSGTSPDTYVVRVMDPRRGALSAGTIQESPFGVFALDRAGVVLIDAIGPVKIISDEVEDIIRTINLTAIDTAYSGYDTKESRYYLAIPTDGASTPNKTLVYKADERSWSVLSGQEGACIAFGFSSTGESRSLSGQAIGGRIVRFDENTNVTNLGTAITSEYLSGPFYCGDPTKKKKAKFVYITAESAADWTIDIDIVPDFGQTQQFSLADINSNGAYSVYASSLTDSGVRVGIFDESFWSGATIKKQLKIPVSSIGYGFQVRITNDSTDSAQYGFKILSVELECSVMGK
tara:strand:- start:1886 stop:3934 length:2049 start_codon:yes stop_codon:yes gene_type:complete